MQDYIKIHPQDCVAVALKPLPSNTVVSIDGEKLLLTEDIPQGHKFALKDIDAGESILKYGSPIGIAKENIKQGSWVHTHNIKTGLGDLLTYSYKKRDTCLKPTEDVTFWGYRREDGSVGVRNEIWIIPTVGCVNSIAQRLVRENQHLVQGTVEICFRHSGGNRGVSPPLRLFPDGGRPGKHKTDSCRFG